MLYSKQHTPSIVLNIGGEGMTYGELLKDLRISAGLTQKQLGLACGYPQSTAENTVQYWEAGTRLPPVMKLRILAEALNVPVDKVVPW